jgi:uncharacterized protein involved in exopolysaccharide biosynthesis
VRSARHNGPTPGDVESTTGILAYPAGRADQGRVPPTNGQSRMATDHDGPSPPSAQQRLPRRLWVNLALLAVLLVVMGAGAGYGVGMVVPPTYAARADVLYLLTREQPTGFLREDRNLSTQLVLLTSRTVLGPVSAQTGVPVDDLADALEATVEEESEVIRIEFRDGDPQRAQAVLDAVVAEYLQVSNNDERADVRRYLEEQLTVVLDRIVEARNDGNRTSELAPLVDREQQLRSRLDDLNLSDLAGPGARVLVPPYVATDPVSPNPLVTAVTGGLTALLVAALVLAVVARRQMRS